MYIFTINKKKIAMSPSRYESLLQIYKTPKAALDSTLKYYELDEKGEIDRDEDEEKEFKKLKRMFDLAENFDKSHRYMLDKEEYSQQDVDYVFALDKKEREAEGRDDKRPQDEILTGFGHSASATYKLLIMQKIFHGMKNRFEAENKGEQDRKQILEWLEQDSLNCIRQSPHQMKMIIRGIKRSLKNPDEKTIQDKVYDLIEGWFKRSMGSDVKGYSIKSIRTSLEDEENPLYRKIESMTDSVMNEEDDALRNEDQGKK